MKQSLIKSKDENQLQTAADNREYLAQLEDGSEFVLLKESIEQLGAQEQREEPKNREQRYGALFELGHVDEEIVVDVVKGGYDHPSKNEVQESHLNPLVPHVDPNLFDIL